MNATLDELLDGYLLRLVKLARVGDKLAARRTHEHLADALKKGTLSEFAKEVLIEILEANASGTEVFGKPHSRPIEAQKAREISWDVWKLHAMGGRIPGYEKITKAEAMRRVAKERGIAYPTVKSICAKERFE